MNNKILSYIAAACLTVALSSCYTINLRNASGQPPAQMGPANGTVLGHFSEARHAHFLIYGLINLGTPNVSEVLQEQVQMKQGASVANLQLTTTHTFVDGLISAITGGIYNPVTVEF